MIADNVITTRFAEKKQFVNNSFRRQNDSLRIYQMNALVAVAIFILSANWFVNVQLPGQQQMIKPSMCPRQNPKPAYSHCTRPRTMHATHLAGS